MKKLDSFLSVAVKILAVIYLVSKLIQIWSG